MKKTISIKDVKELSKKYKLTHCVVLGYDKKTTYIATYGHSIEACSQAADFGNKLKTALGWPSTLHAQPSRVRKLQARIKELEEQLAKKECKI